MAGVTVVMPYHRKDERVVQNLVRLKDVRHVREVLLVNDGCSWEPTEDIAAILSGDEAQNLTPHEVKTIVTRAGENTKVILTGDVRQIDTPYLDENSNGLSYVIERLKGSDLYCHITLAKGERSDLANLANEKL